MAFRSSTSMPWARSRAVLASELETAPAMRFLSGASASMKKLTVEPVPTPITSPSRTNSIAASAARCFCRSWVIVMAPPKTTVPAFAGTVVKLL